VEPLETARPRPALRAHVLDAVRREPLPPPAARPVKVAIACALGAGFSVAVSVWLGLELPAERRPDLIAVTVLGGGAAALVATWIAAGRGRSMLGRSLGALLGVALLGPLVLLGTSFALPRALGETTTPGEFGAAHAICFAYTALFALGPFAALAYARRGSDPLHPRALGAALGTAAGAWGLMLMSLHCAFTSATHVTLSHVGPVVAGAFLGALGGARIFGVRAR
jgi:hypothetical protein